MKSDRFEWRLVLQVLALFASLLFISFTVIKGVYVCLFLGIPVVIYQLIKLISFQKKVQDEVMQFVAAVHYRDFSRHYDVKKAPARLKLIREGFNEINDTLKLISREREAQYQYLQKILELVDTGIISYEQETGETAWINESFKLLLGIPYLKKIQAIEKREPSLYKDIINLKSGESKVVTISRNQQHISILVSVSVFKSDEKYYKLLAFQNVSDALDETESKAWQKLLSVMTHEIMNSVAPISSLAETLKNRLKSPEFITGISENDLDDIELGIDTIRRRSDGLLRFTENYRNLNRINALDLNPILITDLFENISGLMLPSLEKKGIELEVVIKDLTLAIEVDVNLIEQVLINILVNATEAVKDSPKPIITLTAEPLDNKKVGIKVSDNGIGMHAELLDKIFIPFFSTRKTGSGIGLSLCKQIMLLHRGNIQVQSVEGKGSTFLLQFNMGRV
ncbi:histidine kinase/DNA gyrase B/HSP90-like ATPase [Mucilaginibacter yixingensis]|uniref:histidine kinase n=1 Tax=Mucilaginibacter yixingensis TaxID=1295612 RepID=A0A2T5JGJ2_9SPHI|nr:HAMP domain-containing sensor histidine kinase [Mucilaginibacter yixingensis]PTR01529.1 histidine kinase/DNA gyrase B/HSP90-like ATPase [Mucilaginibacter yixingensis]